MVVGTVMLHRCRPAGAKEGWASHNYTDVAPLGLRKERWGSHNYTDVAPLGLKGVGTAMLHRCRPAGAKNLFVVVRFIARSLLVNGIHRVLTTLHHTYSSCLQKNSS